MHNASDCVTKLEQISQCLSMQNDKYISATKQLMTAVETGRDDESLMAEVGEARQAYRSTRVDAVKFVQECKELLCKEAVEARKRGVAYPTHEAESLPIKNLDDCDHKFLINSIECIQIGLTSLITAVDTFESLQLKIQAQLEQLKFELGRLIHFRINTDHDETTLKTFEDQFANIAVSRTKLKEMISDLLITWQERLHNSLKSKVYGAYAKLETELERLQDLGSATEIDHSETKNFKDELQHSEAANFEQLLDRIEVLLHDWEQRADLARRQLNEVVENLRQEAKREISQLHSQMPEVVILNELLTKGVPQGDAKLATYCEQLESSVINVKNANNNAIKYFQRKIQEDSEYVFVQQEEIAILGTALVNVAGESEQLWWLGDDVMVRLMLSNLEGIDEQEFYERYGYAAVANAITTATRNYVFSPILSLFNSNFLPPTNEPGQDKIETLLKHPLVKQAFSEAVEANTIRFNPEEFQKFSINKQKASLTLLSHKDALKLPATNRLQWAALLHNAFETGSTEHYTATRLLLDALLDSEQYFSFYYALRALEADYPDLWTVNSYRPMLSQLILHTFKIEETGTDIDGRKFLVDLCLHPDVRQLAKGDFDTEFLVAALAHHAAVRWDRSELVNDAWAAWDKLKAQYPVISRILQRELQGEHFGTNIVIDIAELSHQLGDTLKDLTTRMQIPGSAHPRGYQIQNWYVEHYMNRWLDLLKTKDIYESILDRLLAEISTLFNREDLIEVAEVDLPERNRRAKDWAASEKFRSAMNRRLFELLTSFQQAVRIRKQIIMGNPIQTVSREELQQELNEIYNRSQMTVWILEHLLAPGLPFIQSMVNND